VAHRPEGAPDQPLDLDGPPVRTAARDAALRALAGRRGKHRVLGGHPAAAVPLEPSRHALLDGCRAEDERPALPVEDRAVRLLQEVDTNLELAERVRPTAVGSHAAAARRAAISTCSADAIGSWRKRCPISRNWTGSPVVRNRYEPSRASSFSTPLRA